MRKIGRSFSVLFFTGTPCPREGRQTWEGGTMFDEQYIYAKHYEAKALCLWKRSQNAFFQRCSNV